MSLSRLLPRAFRLLFVSMLFAATSPLVLAQKTIHVPADQPTIQAGINAASNGDMVLISPGIYYENLIIDTKEISLVGANGAANTILDGGSKSIALIIHNTPTLKTLVSGITIQHGLSNIYLNGGDGGGRQ